jgi:hypothetical protein
MTKPTFDQQMEQVTKTLGSLRLQPTKSNTKVFEALVSQLETLDLIHRLTIIETKGGENEQE